MNSLESKLQAPMHYPDFIGQDDAVARLRAFSDFYRKNGSTAEHVLLVAEEGMGKRTIANVLARELGVPSQEVSASQLQVKGDLTAILTNLRTRQVLVVEDVHRLGRALQDILLEALQTHKLPIQIGQGSKTRHHVMDVQPFTLVGTVPKKSECPEGLLSSFALVLPLQAYTNSALEKIGERIAADESIEIEAGAIKFLVANSQSRPDKLKLLMQRVARALSKPIITEGDARQVLGLFGIMAQTDTHTGGSADLERMSGVEFERFVTALLTRMEFRPEMTKATGDGGIDIVAILDKPILGGKYLFQCKRYAPENLVGASTVRDFYGAVTADKAVKGILITTSDFTAQAREFAERVGVELINLPRLRSLLAQHGIGK